MRPAPDQEEVASQIRANIAFGHMVAAVLAGTALSGTGRFILVNIAALFGGALSGYTLVESVIDSLWFACLIFLIGFGASVAVCVPLFMALERVKYRTAWPYFAVALLLELAAYTLMAGGVPVIATPATLLYLLPGVIIAYFFIRNIRPLWRAAKRAETAPAVVRSH